MLIFLLLADPLSYVYQNKGGGFFMKPLFINQITIQAEVMAVTDYLMDVTNLPEWNPSIQAIKINEDNYQIIRMEQAINQTETVTVSKESQKVIFQIYGDMLRYTLTFDLEKNAENTNVTEKLTILENHKLHLPIVFYKPIVKQAFAKNLTFLKQRFANENITI